MLTIVTNHTPKLYFEHFLKLLRGKKHTQQKNLVFKEKLLSVENTHYHTTTKHNMHYALSSESPYSKHHLLRSATDSPTSNLQACLQKEILAQGVKIIFYPQHCLHKTDHSTHHSSCHVQSPLIPKRKTLRSCRTASCREMLKHPTHPIYNSRVPNHACAPYANNGSIFSV